MSEEQKTIQDNSHDLFAVRKAKLDAMRAKGFDPFRAEWTPTHTSKTAIESFDNSLEEGQNSEHEVSVAGRVLVFRLMGKASFLKIQDRDGIIQLYVARDGLPEGVYNDDFKKNLDLGDIIGARGKLFKTKTGEITVRVSEFKMLAKSLRPLPEKWHGLTNSEQIYRQRYLDLMVNQESRKRFKLRSAIVREIREFLWSRDFMEVETPVLHSVAGGAAARPFITHFNALDCDFYLRIALELYLKRMLVGGFDRVFEMGRVFRNEGVDRKHNPEFTMLEVYQAYSDHRGMMELFRSMITRICENVLGTTTIQRADGGKGYALDVIPSVNILEEHQLLVELFDCKLAAVVRILERNAVEINVRAVQLNGESVCSTIQIREIAEHIVGSKNQLSAAVVYAQIYAGSRAALHRNCVFRFQLERIMAADNDFRSRGFFGVLLDDNSTAAFHC